MGGLGSRHSSKGMQYAVSFGSGIELEIKTPWKKNKIVILGSNEPDVLREVLHNRIHNRIKLVGGEVPEALVFDAIADMHHIDREGNDINQPG